MRIHGWNFTAAAALACLALGAGAATAQAGAPVGEKIVEDARDRAVVDGDLLVYMAVGGTVRRLELASPVLARRDLTQTCSGQGLPGRVIAASGGSALLSCAEPAPGVDPAVAGARVIDLDSGALTVPATPQLSYAPDRDRLEYTGMDAGRICFSLTFDKDAPRKGAFDWRTGAVDWTAACTGPRPGIEALTFVPGDQAAYTGRCGVHLGWDVSASVIGGLVAADSVIFSRQPANGAPVSYQRVSLRGLCRRVAAGWRLTAAAGGRRTVARLRTAVGEDRVTGADTRLTDPVAGGRPLVLGRAGRVQLRTGTPAAHVRWRLGTGRWRAATRRRGAWSIDGVEAGARTRSLRIGVDFRGGGRAGYAVPVRR